SAVAAKPGADLAVTSVGKPPASVAAGARLTVSFAVRNGGSKRAGASTIGFLLSADARRDAADVPLGPTKAQALAPRRTQRGTAKLEIPSGIRGGTYRLLVCADLAGRVRERNERNNCRAGAKVTVQAGAGSDVLPARPSPETAQLPAAPTGPGTGTPDVPG